MHADVFLGRLSLTRSSFGSSGRDFRNWGSKGKRPLRSAQFTRDTQFRAYSNRHGLESVTEVLANFTERKPLRLI
jgi:hypothetical protein